MVTLILLNLKVLHLFVTFLKICHDLLITKLHIYSRNKDYHGQNGITSQDNKIQILSIFAVKFFFFITYFLIK